MFYEPTPQEMFDGGFILPIKLNKANAGTFKSTVDRDMYHGEQGWYVGAKEYPCWYGIPNIGFIWRGTQSDPVIEYKGHQFSCYYVEDDMWNQFIDEYPNGTEEEFEQYMLSNIDDVYELCENMIRYMEM